MQSLTTSEQQSSFISNNINSIIYFGFPSCKFCIAITPFVNSLIPKYPNIAFGYVDISTVNVENIRGAPTFVFYKNGMPFNLMTGTDKNKLLNIINKEF